MKWFHASKAPASLNKCRADGIGVAEAIAIARTCRGKGEWPEALVALERVPGAERSVVEYRLLHAWALGEAGRTDAARAELREAFSLAPRNEEVQAAMEEGRHRIRSRPKHDGGGGQRGTEALRFGSGVFDISPNDSIVLTQLVQDARPGTIFECGTHGGGVACWLAALTTGMGLETRVHSADWWLHSGADTGRLTFHAGDLRKPGSIWPGSFLQRAARPWLVLLRPGGGYGVAWSALRAWQKWLAKGDVICLFAEEGGAGDALRKRTAEDAMARFAATHPVEHEALAEYARWFGEDRSLVSLRCLRRTAFAPLDEAAAPELESIRRRMAKGEWREALAELNAIKATRKPRRGADYLRALCFLNLGENFSVCEAAKEELRYFPDHEHAAAVLASTMRQLFPGRPRMGNDEFAELYAVVRPYTMLSDARLHSIYLRTRLLCQMDVPGDFVECGVAAGGASALMAAVAARHSRRPRRIFACDTFEGMPAPTGKDVHDGTGAEASGWGSGTCAAPPGSLMEVAHQLCVADRVEPVKGLFSDTLPSLKERLADGIAFLHMDGDWYESTRDILMNLYDKVWSLGFIQVDDYGHWKGCSEAMNDFARELGFEFKVNPIDDTGVWFQRPDRQAADLMMLNLGCGAHYHGGWVNMDIKPAGPMVIEHDLAGEPLPFDGGTCRMVYHSHVLEHIDPARAPAFIAECFRVLAPGGVLRIAVPDLEGIAREYLRLLDAGDEAKHEWMVIELIDQLAREHPGGRMLEYWKQNPMPAEAFVFERVGWEARRFVEEWRKKPHQDAAARALTAQEVGAFRLGGEPHKWMYDRVSLRRLLQRAGFKDFTVRSATESAHENFAGYLLDADASGQVRKPDSLFVEARK